MVIDTKEKRLIELYKELPPIKKEEAFDFIKWLWVSKESKLLEGKKLPGWLKKLYFTFAEVRKQAKKSSSKQIDLSIKEAIKEVRKKYA